MNYVDYEDILRRKRALSDLLASGAFDPKKASTEDIRWAQRLIGTNDDGLWGTQSRKALDAYRPYGDDSLKRALGNGEFDPETASTQDIKAAQSIIGTKADGVWGDKSQAALDAYKKSYDGPVKFNWGGMEGNEAAQAYSAWDTRRIEAEEKLAANEQRIEELKQEYLALQQKQETATEDLERNVAANRAGIGDTSQYNAWRARVEAREAQNQAREADSDATLRQAKAKVDRAFSDIGWARGERQTELARAAYKDAVDEYNELARKYGKPEISESELVNKDTVTMFDTKDFIRQHRNSKGQWDSEENRQKAYEMARSLGDEGVPLLDEIYGQITTGKAKANQASYDAKVQAEVDKIDLTYVGDGDTVNIEIDGKPVPAKVQVKTDGSYVAVVNGKNYKMKQGK